MLPFFSIRKTPRIDTNQDCTVLFHSKWSCLKVFLIFLFVCTIQNTSSAEQQPNSHEILKRFLPLPEYTPREIQNPYHAKATWKMWQKDPSDVVIDKPHFKGHFGIVAIKDRKIPTFDAKAGSLMILQEPDDSSMAGFFDDAYMSLDNYHTRLIFPQKQFIQAGTMSTARDYQTRFDLGVNFTSQSYASRGRAIVDDLINNLNTEKYFFFANTIRATPAHNSFKDVETDSVTDSYDALHAHSFHSIGQSNSEVHALTKMLIAGASMPRTTKDLLKQNGAYAIVLLTLFKLALPYSDSDGFALPYEHELRHKVAYSSNGDPFHKHFCYANVHFHGYDESRHLWDMARLARGMTIAPPVAVLKIAGVRINTPDGPITESSIIGKRIKNASLTAVRFWGEPGERLEMLVDLRESYDLQEQNLTYTCQKLYPNQNNVHVQRVSSGQFSISVSHDPKLPKGRIPVICTVRNRGEVPSNPVFINFYWPGKKELPDYGLPQSAEKKIKDMGLKKYPVTVNKRPQVKESVLGDTVMCRPGDTVNVTFKTTDPEGYPIKTYRRLDQRGTLVDGNYKVSIKGDEPSHIERVHFLFSDGTGGYNSRQIKLSVSDKTQTRMESPWGVSQLGKTSPNRQVVQSGETYRFQGDAPESDVEQPQGLFAFRLFSDDVDLVARIPLLANHADIGVLLTNSLDAFSRRAYIGLFKGEIHGQVRPREQTWGNDQKKLDNAYRGEFGLFRIVSRNGNTAVFVSEDGKTWAQVVETKIRWFKTVYAGILYGGSDESLTSQWIEPSEGIASIHTVRARKDKNDNYVIPLVLDVNVPNGYTARYTLDGSSPTGESLQVGEKIELETAGRVQVRVTTFKNDDIANTTTVMYSLVGKEPGK